MIASCNFRKATRVVNLRELYGQRYQVAYDPAYYCEHGRNGRVDDPELQIIPCRHGHIFPWGGQLLAASTDSRGAIANKLAALDCCRIEQDADDGMTLSFHIRNFRVVANLIKPRGRRRLDPTRRQAFIDAGRATRHSKRPGQTAISVNVIGEHSPGSTSGACEPVGTK